jgi:O-acetyl-ADP-ribose deacetylase (regulator of RNase III)
MADAHAAACARGEVVPGRMFTVEVGDLTGPRWIVNFPTKRHWRDPSLMADIEAGLPALAAEIRAKGMRSIAVPALGCGLGGLDWAAVKPRIAAALGGLDGVEVLVFEPLDEPM